MQSNEYKKSMNQQPTENHTVYWIVVNNFTESFDQIPIHMVFIDQNLIKAVNQLDTENSY